MLLQVEHLKTYFYTRAGPVKAVDSISYDIYTRALLSAVPIPDSEVERARERLVLTGEIPSPLAPPAGCGFHPRCPDRLPICSAETPPLIDQGGGHCVACHLYT